MSPQERKEYMKEYHKKWIKSPAGKAYREKGKAWYKSEKRLAYVKKVNASAAHKVYMKAFCSTPEQRARIIARNTSPEWKAHKRAWYRTPAGQESARISWAKRHGNCEIIERVKKDVLLEMYNHTCPYCGGSLKNDRSTHIDHIIPIARYIKIGKKFPYKYSTVAPAHAHCNEVKQNNTPLEYFWGQEAASSFLS